MATMLNGTTAKNLIDSAMDSASEAASTAKDAVGSAKIGTQHAAASARSNVMVGIHMVTSVVAMLRNLGLAEAFGWVGLQRRRNPLLSAGIFGAGFAAGAGAGVLLAPMSGAALRGKILKSFTGAGAGAKETLHRIEAEVHTDVAAVQEKAGALAGQAKDAVVKAERTAEHKVEAATGAVKHAVNDAMGALAASDARATSTHGTNGTEGAKQGASSGQHR